MTKQVTLKDKDTGKIEKVITSSGDNEIITKKLKKIFPRSKIIDIKELPEGTSSMERLP